MAEEVETPAIYFSNLICRLISLFGNGDIPFRIISNACSAQALRYEAVE
jgi:hypothetical protein